MNRNVSLVLGGGGSGPTGTGTALYFTWTARGVEARVVDEPAGEGVADRHGGQPLAGQPSEDRRRAGHEQAAPERSPVAPVPDPRHAPPGPAEAAVAAGPELGSLDAGDPEVPGGPHDGQASRHRPRRDAGGQEREQVVDVHQVGPHPVDLGVESGGRRRRPRGRRGRAQLVDHASGEHVVVRDLVPVDLDARGPQPVDLEVDGHVLAGRRGSRVPVVDHEHAHVRVSGPERPARLRHARRRPPALRWSPRD